MGRAPRLILAALSLVVGALLALAAVLLVFEFSIPLEGFKQRADQGLSRLTGGEVVINGTLSLVTGGRPRIEATNLAISQSVAGYGLQARLGRVGIDLRLAPLLAGRVSIAQVEVRENFLCLSPENGKPASGDGANRTGKEASWYLPRIERVLVEGFDLVKGPDCDRGRTLLHVATLEWTAPAGSEPRVQARGAVGEEPWSAEVSGPFLASFSGEGAQFALAAEAAGARLTANGRAALLPLAVSADVAFDSPEFGRLLTLAGTPIKGFGPLSVRGNVSADRSRVGLRIDRADLSPGTVAGDLSVLWSGPRPQILIDARSPEFAAFAMEHWLIGAAAAEKPKLGGVPEWITTTIRGTDGEFSLAVEQLIVGRVPLGTATYRGKWQDAKVDGTLTGSMGNQPIEGMLSLDMSADVATLAARWKVSKASLPAGLGVSGTVASVEGQLSGRAGPEEIFADSLRINLSATDARLLISTESNKPIPLQLRSARAEWRGGKTLRLDLAGALFGQPSSVQLEGTNAWRLFQGESWPMTSSGKLGPLQFAARGSLGLPPSGSALDIEFSAKAKRLGTLAGDSGRLAGLPAEIEGRFALAAEGWKATVASARLGKSLGRGELARPAGREPRPLEARIALETLDLEELAGPPAGKRDPDRVVIPGDLLPPDFDLALDVARVVLEGASDARLTLNAKSNGGRLEIAPFTLSLGRGRIDGKLGAELGAGRPRFTAKLLGRTIEDKYLKRWLNATGWYFEIGNGELDLSTSGTRPREWAANADHRFVARQVRVAAADAREQTSAEFSSLTITSTPGKPASLSADGTAAGSPLAVKATADRFDQLLLGNETPFQATGTLASLEWQASGRLPLAVGSGRRLKVRVAAERADALKPLLGPDLPPVGPVALDAVLTGRERDLSADVKIALGQSTAAGTVSRRPGDRPFYAVDLTASLLRLEDLGLKHWMDKLKTETADRERQAVSVNGARQGPSPGEGPGKALSGFDARVAFKAERLMAQDASLGSGEFKATLKAGKLDIPGVRIKSPDGDLSASASADFSSQPPRLTARADISGFRYGPLLKALDPARNEKGEMSLKFDLTANASPGDIAPHLDGTLNLLLLPRGERVAIFDRLGAGLLNTLAGAFDPDSASKLNCAVGSFSINNGIARSDTILLDATRVRAAGELEVNLATEALKGIVAPKSKRPAVFSADVALEIGGTLRDPKVSVPPKEIAIAAARNIYYAYGFLFEILTWKEVPADGSEECRAIYQRVLE